MCFFLGEMYVYIFCPLCIKRHYFAYCLLLVCRSFLSLSCFYLFAVCLGLCCCSRAVSSCGEREAVVQLRRVGLLPWLLSLRSTGSRCAGSAAVARGLQSTGPAVVHLLSCPEARGVFLDQGSSRCPLHCKESLNHWTTQEAPHSCS